MAVLVLNVTLVSNVLLKTSAESFCKVFITYTNLLIFLIAFSELWNLYLNLFYRDFNFCYKILTVEKYLNQLFNKKNL